MNFGYNIQKDRQLDYDLTNKQLLRYFNKFEPTFNLCISCGTCSATCSAAGHTDFSLRKVILKIQRGDTAGLNSEIRKCMLCGKCQLACPKSVNTRGIILKLLQLTEND